MGEEASIARGNKFEGQLHVSPAPVVPLLA